MYAGLTIADKYALEDLKYRYGGEYSVYLRSTRCWTNIDLALAQIAEIETAQTTTLSPLTWNERINQMTVSEKADWMKDNDFCIVMKLPENGCFEFNSCTECLETWLNSPYTEGATK